MNEVVYVVYDLVGIKQEVKYQYVNSRMSSRGYEIQAAVHSGIWDAFLASNVDFFLQKFLILFIDMFGYWLPAKNIEGKNKISGVQIQMNN